MRADDELRTRTVRHVVLENFVGVIEMKRDGKAGEIFLSSGSRMPVMAKKPASGPASMERTASTEPPASASCAMCG